MTLEAIAIELREQSNRVTFAVRDPDFFGQMSTVMESARHGVRPNESGWMVPVAPELTITDDLGTHYTSVQTAGGGGEKELRTEIGFAPPVPAAARRLSLIVERLSDSPFPGMPGGPPPKRTIEGPWRFDVEVQG